MQQQLAELQESDLKYRDLYDNMLDLAMLIDSGGVIQQSNRQSLTLLGKDPAELRQENISDFIASAKPGTAWLVDTSRQLAQTPSVQGMQLHLANSQGETIEVEVSASKVEIDHTSYLQLMKRHTIFGSEVLAGVEDDSEESSFLMIGREIARSHHEHWDARGYPDGLPGDTIPLAARIIALADVNDALTSTRVYKPPFNHEESKEIITRESGRQFDPRVVAAFLRRENDFRETRMRLLFQQSPEAAGSDL